MTNCRACHAPTSDLARVRVESTFVAKAHVGSETLAAQRLNVSICEGCLQQMWDRWESSLMPEKETT